MKRAEITALVLSYNEAENLERTLAALSWCQRVVLIDSYSTDGTLEIAKAFQNVEVFQRKFDSFAEQCNFGLRLVKSKWTLSVDADYVLQETFCSEIENLPERNEVAGYEASFRYCVHGVPLRATLYPPRTVLYRTALARYENDGHGHRVNIRSGIISRLVSIIRHDDRKPLRRWLAAQIRYAEQETTKLSQTPRNELDWKDRLRKRYVITPILTPIYCLFWKRLLLDGIPGLHYTFQRTYAELLLALAMAENRLRQRANRLRNSGRI